VYAPDPSSVLFVASPDPFELESRAEAVIAGDPETFARAGLRVREDLAAALVLDEAGARRLAEGAEVASDDENRFATHSPRVLGRALGNVERLFAPHDPLLARLDGLDALYLVQHLVRIDRVRRAQRLAKAIRSPLERTLAELEIAVGRRESRKARGLLERALAIDPGSEWARYRALPVDGAAAPDAADNGTHVLREARRLHAARDWQGLAHLDPALAGFALRHPAQPDAQQLRIDWRIGSGDAGASAEAIRLIDLEPFSGAEQLARRALAGAQSREPGVASQSLEQLAGELRGKLRALSPIAVEWALAALDATPEDELSVEARKLRPPLQRMRDRKPRATG
jgi:hypothetical protein